MPSRRQDGATAALGYGLVAAGGAVRGGAIDDAHTALKAEKRAVPSSMAVLRAHRARVPGAAKIVRRFGVGTALVTVGAPAAGLGTYDLVRRRTSKAFTLSGRRIAEIKHANSGGRALCGRVTTGAQLTGAPKRVSCPTCRKRMGVTKRKSLVHEGVAGTGEAWKQKGESLRSGAPVRTRAVPIALGAGGGGLSALATHRGLDLAEKGLGRGVPGKTRAALAAVAAVPGTLATIPVSRRVTRRQGYTVTPTGTKKVVKADYAGRHISYAQQRARITAAGSTPVVGPVLAARQAERYAPPGHRHAAVARQLTATGLGTYSGYRAGKFAATKAQTSPRFRSATQKVYGGMERMHSKLPAAARKVVRLKPASEAGVKGVAAFVGYKVGSAAIGGPGTQTAITRDIAAERRYDRRQHESVGKLDSIPMPDKQRHRLIRRKKVGATLNVLGGTAGLTALSLLGSKHPAAVANRERALVASAGIGGANAFNSASINRREAKADKAALSKAYDPETSSWSPEKADLAEFSHNSRMAALRNKNPKDYRPARDLYLKRVAAYHKHERTGVYGRPMKARIVNPGGRQVMTRVIKSLGPNGTYTPATQMKRSELRSAPRRQALLRQGYSDAWGQKLPSHQYDQERVRPSSTVKNLHFGPTVDASTQHKIERAHGTRPLRYPVHVHDTPGALPDGVLAGAMSTPQGKPRHILLGSAVHTSDDADLKRIWHHEVTHTQSKSPGHLGGTTRWGSDHRLGHSPARAREEARADHISARYGDKVTGYESRPHRDYRKMRTQLGGARWKRPPAHARIHAAAKEAGVHEQPGVKAVVHVARNKYAYGGVAALGGVAAARRNRNYVQAHSVAKAQQQKIQTNLDDKTAHSLVHGKGGYGLTGPLPKHLDRQSRMTAYEARYVASGGHKKQRWQHVVDVGDRMRNAGIAGGATAGAAWLGATSPRARKLVAPMAKLKHFERVNSEAVKHKAERAAIASATFGGAGELAEEHAKRKRAAYSTAPGGVAASALRRMQAYTP